MSKRCRNFPTVSARRMQAVELLAQGLSQNDVCCRLKVTSRTLRSYLADPAVRSALQEAQGERLAALTRQSLESAREALDVLKRVMNDTEMSSAARVSAARAVAEVALRLAGPAIKVEVSKDEEAVDAREQEARESHSRRLELCRKDPKYRALMLAAANIEAAAARALRNSAPPGV